MVHQGTSKNEWADRHRQALTIRHSHKDALNDREFELLLEACRELPTPRGFEARFIFVQASGHVSIAESAPDSPWWTRSCSWSLWNI